MSVHWEFTYVGGKPMRIYVGVPDGDGPHPAVLVAQHRGGVDEHMQDVVHRLHRAGYVVAAPELFHRQAPDIEASLRVGLLRDDQIIADLGATIDHLRSKPVQLGRIGIVGFCSGGRTTYLAATAIPDLQAAVVFYGGNIMKPQGDGPSPFEATQNIQCPLLGFFGADDKNPSPEDVQKISAELTRWNKWHEFHTFQDTGHAFHNFKSEYYRDRAARSSWAAMLVFLEARLKGRTTA